MLYIIVTKTITKTKKSSESTINKTKTKTRLHFLLKLISILKLFSLPKQYCHTPVIFVLYLPVFTSASRPKKE